MGSDMGGRPLLLRGSVQASDQPSPELRGMEMLCTRRSACPLRTRPRGDGKRGSVTEEPDSSFYLVLSNLNVSSRTGSGASVLDSTFVKNSASIVLRKYTCISSPLEVNFADLFSSFTQLHCLLTT